MPFPTFEASTKRRPPGFEAPKDLWLEHLQKRYHVMFAMHFHILPRDWDDLYLDEVRDFVAAADQILAEGAKARQS